MITYRNVREEEINRELFRHFIRHQEVTKCWRKVNGEWIVKYNPFVDDWSEKEYEILVKCLRNTVHTGGLVYAAFFNDELKGFVSVESQIFGGEHQYLDLSSIHVSEDMRHQGIGKVLFAQAKRWAADKGAKKLYISSHSSVESQAFYRKMGCVEAALYDKEHVEMEPYDCQLECSC